MPTEDSRPATGRRLAAVAVLLVPLAVALLARAPRAGDVEVIIHNPDCLYQLGRIERCLRDFPSIAARDPRSHHPRGNRIHWLAPYTVAHASIAKLLGIEADDRAALVRALSWLPPLLGVAAVWLTTRLAIAQVARPACGSIAGIIAALSGSAWTIFGYGAIDHHGAAHIGVLLMCLARLRRSLPVWSLGLVILTMSSPRALLYATVVVGILAASELIGGAVADSMARLPDRPLWLLTPAAAYALALVAQRAFESDPLPLTSWTWTYLSLFHVAWFAGLGLLAIAMLSLRDRAIGIAGKSLAFSTAVGGAAFLGVFAFHATGEADVFLAQILHHGAKIGERGTLLNKSFIELQPWNQILLLLCLALVARAALRLFRRAPAERMFAAVVAAAAIVLGLSEFRHLSVLFGIVAAGIATLVFELSAWLQQRPLLQGGRGGVAIAVAWSLLIGPPLLDFYNHTRATNQLLFARVARRIDPVIEWLRGETPAASSASSASSADSAPADGVFSSWPYGHHINVLAGRPAVVDPFNHSWVGEVEQELFMTETADELVDVVETYQARYLVVVETQREILSRQEDEKEWALRADWAPSGIVYRDELTRFALLRLFLGSGLTSEMARLRPRYLSLLDISVHFLEADGGVREHSIPHVQIYEVVQGAVIEGVAEPGVEVYLEVTVERLTTPPKRRDVRFDVAVADDGTFAFHTSLPAPVEETTFRVIGPYRLHIGSWPSAVVVTEESVASGERLRLKPLALDLSIPPELDF